MSPKYRRLVIPGALLLLIAIVVMTSVSRG